MRVNNLKYFFRKYWFLVVIIMVFISFYVAYRQYNYETINDVMTFNQFVAQLFGLITHPMTQLFILLLTGLSSFFMIRGVMKISPMEMAIISAAHLGFNSEVGKSFAVQKADTVIGFVLLVISLLVQVLAISQPLRWTDVDGLGFVQVLFVLAFFALVWWKSESWRCKLIKKYLSGFSEAIKRSLYN